MPGGSSISILDMSGGPGYSQLVGFIYVFNLIVGTGALTMPNAFEEAGWLISLIVVILLAFTSYLTVTFLIESMAAANAVLKHQTAQTIRKSRVPIYDTGSTEERQPLLKRREPSPLGYGADSDCSVEEPPAPILDAIGINASVQSVNPENLFLSELFDISNKVELGEMAGLFFGKVGIYLFYISMIVYLYGDLSVYAAAVPKSLRDIVCFQPGNGSECGNTTLNDTDPCFHDIDLTRADMYRILVAAFGLFLGPFTFFNVQKTKYLQVFTTLMRWLAFSTMIALTSIRLVYGEGRGHPVPANIDGVPTLFGVCVYSFMCHHSLPSLVTPIKDKSRIHSLFAADYLLILGFYALLSFTGIFTFESVQDLYTLNFEPCAPNPITDIAFFQYFLSLFPVFTLSTSFPIIAITLRNNLIALFKRERPTPWVVKKIFFPLLTILPPIGVALGTSNLGVLVGITGSYAGAAIQYVIPAFLVFCSRKITYNLFEENVKNPHISPFRHKAWIILVLIWAVACVILVTVNHILSS